MVQQAVAEVTPQPATLLIVEDDPDIASVLRDIFTMTGYKLRSASSGADALRILEDEQVDLIVLDVMLPDMSGYEVCEKIRATASDNLPVVMLTALTQPDNITNGFQAGADDYVKKPFMPEELLLRVSHLLERHSRVRAAEHSAEILRNTLTLTQRQLEASEGATQTEVTLRREFLHNVTTHMQALSGIVDAVVRKLPPGPEREVVQQLKGRVRGAALVYEISEALQSDPVEIGQVISTIASALKSMYRPWRRVQLNVSGTPTELSVTLASPLAMIVNELITNCFKHAFPDNRFGAINVSYGVVGSAFEVRVVDDGAGFGPEQPSAGMGRQTILQLVQGLGGTATWRSDGKGTAVTVCVPLAA